MIVWLNRTLLFGSIAVPAASCNVYVLVMIDINKPNGYAAGSERKGEILGRF